MIIENSKTYNFTDVDNIFFRPTFCGKGAEELGIRVIYNMPVPTKVPVFTHANNILATFSSGWQGGTSSAMSQKEIQMIKLKAESSYTAEDYFSTIYEMIISSSDVALGDLTGTELEKAETKLFCQALVKSVYATTWFGDPAGNISNHMSFDGFLARFIQAANNGEIDVPLTIYDDGGNSSIEDIFRDAWTSANDNLRALASDGELAFFVSSDIYDAYQFYLDDRGCLDNQNNLTKARPTLTYHGIPLVEIPANGCDLCQPYSFCVLTDRRNLVLALNTADSPEKEIHMWYNPDEMENRQRAVFLAGTTIVDEELLSGAIYEGGVAL